MSRRTSNSLLATRPSSAELSSAVSPCGLHAFGCCAITKLRVPSDAFAEEECAKLRLFLRQVAGAKRGSLREAKKVEERDFKSP